MAGTCCTWGLLGHWHHPHSRGEGRARGLQAPPPCPELLGSWVLPPQQGRGEGRPESQILPGWKDHSCGPVAIAAQLPVAMGASAAGRSHGHHLLLLSGSWRLQAQSLLPQGQGISPGRPSAGLPILPSMCSNPLTFVYIQTCGYLWNPSMLGRKTFVWSYERFTSFRLKERQRKYLIPTWR